ncbi:transmembrane protein 94 isoform X3 [Zootermopsis nevadensis]|uniref:transmembrane protein 94 isoform X3 n=1 Tax=Zootermopsis nevadensis TaxID=136037 RepID=UPI000B8E7C3F|nr:transmembrane protein 94 isoform X3 [Zootermopsis nevadensis]
MKLAAFWFVVPFSLADIHGLFRRICFLHHRRPDDGGRTKQMDSEAGNRMGLTTQEALNRLCQDIETVVDEYKEFQTKRPYGSWLKDMFHHTSRYTTLCWTSALALLLNSLTLFLVYLTSSDPRYSSLPFEGFVILVCLSINLTCVARENSLRYWEIPQRVCNLLEKLKEATRSCYWIPENYPHLCSPFSPCITLQWTYRDGHLVNLPWALLVTGDVIMIRPGQQAPGHCIPFEDKEAPVLHAREVYSPMLHSIRESFSIPMARSPLFNKKYILQETPYLSNLRLALEQALDRPVTYHNRLRHLLMPTCLEQLALPVILVCVLFVNLIRFLYLSRWVGIGHWTEMFLLQTTAVALPLLPVVFPAAWIILDSLGMARIQALIHMPTHSQHMTVDPFEEADLAEPKHQIPEIKWRKIKTYLVDVLRGRGQIPSRSANLLHVLGSVTALCCVDKKGILSWPNPTAEKVFFLRNSSHTSHSSSANSIVHTDPLQTGILEEDEKDEGTSKSSFMQHDYNAMPTVAEVLDLTHDHMSPFRLQFDDHTWKQHLSSLKPLGLAILLNTCNMATQEHYTQFCSHVTCEALYDEDLVPVTNRRKANLSEDMAVLLPGANKCLCELAKQIGFMDQAQDVFKLEDQLSTFRHVQPEVVRRDIKFARSLSMAKLKFPFPHMVAVVMREQSHGDLQLMSQGTADIILDFCVDYWDGHDLCPMSPADRKKVQDFYQRTSLTAYCTAFAYRPLTRGVNSLLSQVYLELPADSKHLYVPHRSPTPLAWDFRNVLDPHCKSLPGHFHSTDSLLGNEVHEEDVNDVEGCFEMQCNQVFIGMVTMQYQAQIDMVQLIEQLERACIRFVHFSKENELRSRVFSEKMGLESGWNCHISLLSERNRSDSGHSETIATTGAAAMSTVTSGTVPARHFCHLSSSPSSLPKCNTDQPDSNAVGEPVLHEERVSLLNARSNIGNSRALSFSAPSAINLDFSQVKFEEETRDWTDESLLNKSTVNHSRDHQSHGESQDSVLVHSMELTSQQDTWRSLSCLTDSTEQSAPINFIMSNRAKLPRGIDKIRPHLEQIDNVPLLVSLFTDCTPSVTREMLHIMQEYGEVVCVIGSSANADNMAIFLQADASLAVEPLYPQVCQKVAVFKETTPDQGPSPVELSRSLNSIACSISFRREDPISIFHLILEFWVCCGVTVSAVQVLGIFLMLPPVLTTGSVLWLVCLVVPLLSLSLVANSTDPQVMQRATGKNQCVVNSQVSMFVLWCYGSKFLPTVFIVLLFYAVTLSCFCGEIVVSTNTTCTMVYPLPSISIPQELWGGWVRHQYSLLTSQHAALALLVLHFVTISISFVEREYSIWHRSPHHNRVWLLVVIITISLQIMYTGISLCSDDSSTQLGVGHIPWYVLTLGLLSSVLIFLINELVKQEEIKANVRYQKRARLEFGTKLGMNSPF